MTTPSFEAVLFAGATETTYRRAGAGKPVLMLFPGGLADPFAARLFEHLAAGARVFSPVQPANVGDGHGGQDRAPAFSAWLRDLIDGLGLVRTTIVADEPVAGAALAFAENEPERVAAVVAVRRGAHTAATVAREIAQLFARLERCDGG